MSRNICPDFQKIQCQSILCKHTVPILSITIKTSSNAGLGTDYEIQPDGLVLTKRPIKTLKFFAMALLQYFARMLRYLLSHKILLLVGGLVLFGWSALSSFEGPHEQVMVPKLLFLMNLCIAYPLFSYLTSLYSMSILAISLIFVSLSCQIMREASAYMKYILWWTGLGVLSSIGLGLCYCERKNTMIIT